MVACPDADIGYRQSVGAVECRKCGIVSESLSPTFFTGSFFLSRPFDFVIEFLFDFLML